MKTKIQFVALNGFFLAIGANWTQIYEWRNVRLVATKRNIIL